MVDYTALLLMACIMKGATTSTTPDDIALKQTT